MPFYFYFEQIFLTLQAQHNNIIVMAVFMILHGLAIVLRLLAFMNYRGHNLILAFDLHPSKALKTISDITSIRSSLLRRIVSDYTVSAEKNPQRVPIDAIVDRHVLSLSLIGWRYSGISQWVKKLDNGLILLGLILALVFPEYAMVYGLLAVSGFILLKLAAAFFDYDTAKRLLINDICIYIEREVGQFFVSNAADAIMKFKEEMGGAIDRQSDILRGAIEKLSADFIPVLDNLQCLTDMPKAVDRMLQSNDRYAVHHEVFMSQAEVIKDTQAALESSLAGYETTLQNLVQVMGDGIGTFIQMYGQNAAADLSEILQDYITQAAKGNQETISTITALVNQLTAQNRDISAQFRALHDSISEI